MRITLPLGARRFGLGQEPGRPRPVPTVPAPIGEAEREAMPAGDTGIPPGKAGLTVPEVKDLLASLDIVVRPIEREERAVVEHECLRELQAGPFPQVVRLRARAAAFLETAAPADLFPVSHGELEVLEKAVLCAESLGRGKAVKTAIVAGGGAAVLALLFLA